MPPGLLVSPSGRSLALGGLAFHDLAQGLVDPRLPAIPVDLKYSITSGLMRSDTSFLVGDLLGPRPLRIDAARSGKTSPNGRALAKSAFVSSVNLGDGTPFVHGKKLTSFSKKEEYDYARDDVPYELEDVLRAEGAEYSSTSNWQPHVVVDGRLITGQNPASAGPLAKELLAALKRAALPA